MTIETIPTGRHRAAILAAHEARGAAMAALWASLFGRRA